MRLPPEPLGARVEAPPLVAATQPGIETDVETVTETRTARPWNVIVHDDPVTLMSYVTHAFMDVFGYSREKARRLMLEVHTEGRSIVWSGAREQAECYVQKLKSRHLRTTLERVND